METRGFRWLVFAIDMLALAGCQHGQSTTTKITPVPPGQPFVFYDDTGDPHQHNPALSARELQKIIAPVATRTSDPIWLIRVKSSYANGIHFSVVAHLVPDETSPRIRVGQAYDMRVSERRVEIDESPWKYAQVSTPGHDFEEQLTRPSVTEMPFRFPYIMDASPQEDSPMSIEDVIGVVDFVRQPSTYRDVTFQPGLSREEITQAILKSPFLDISREGNKINVQLGYMHGPLWGYGWTVTLECTPSGYKVRGWSSWVS